VLIDVDSSLLSAVDGVLFAFDGNFALLASANVEATGANVVVLTPSKDIPELSVVGSNAGVAGEVADNMFLDGCVDLTGKETVIVGTTVVCCIVVADEGVKLEEVVKGEGSGAVDMETAPAFSSSSRGRYPSGKPPSSLLLAAESSSAISAQS
jgi:hypothetical protein